MEAYCFDPFDNNVLKDSLRENQRIREELEKILAGVIDSVEERDQGYTGWFAESARRGSLWPKDLQDVSPESGRGYGK